MQPLFQYKPVLMKLTTLFNSKTKTIYLKPLLFYESNTNKGNINLDIFLKCATY